MVSNEVFSFISDQFSEKFVNCIHLWCRYPPQCTAVAFYFPYLFPRFYLWAWLPRHCPCVCIAWWSVSLVRTYAETPWARKASHCSWRISVSWEARLNPSQPGFYFLLDSLMFQLHMPTGFIRQWHTGPLWSPQHCIQSLVNIKNTGSSPLWLGHLL